MLWGPEREGPFLGIIRKDFIKIEAKLVGKAGRKYMCEWRCKTLQKDPPLCHHNNKLFLLEQGHIEGAWAVTVDWGQNCRSLNTRLHRLGRGALNILRQLSDIFRLILQRAS